RRAPTSTLSPYPTLFRSAAHGGEAAAGRAALDGPDGQRQDHDAVRIARARAHGPREDRLGRGPGRVRARGRRAGAGPAAGGARLDRKSTRLNSSHVKISY